MINFAVSEEKNKWLKDKMAELGIFEKDIKETFVRSSGKGGQKVNKTSTCVYLRHIPSGIQIKCMKDRSQSINRFLARRELTEKIERKMNITTQEDMKLEKIRKQKERRRRKASKKYNADL